MWKYAKLQIKLKPTSEKLKYGISKSMIQSHDLWKPFYVLYVASKTSNTFSNVTKQSFRRFCFPTGSTTNKQIIPAIDFLRCEARFDQPTHFADTKKSTKLILISNFFRWPWTQRHSSCICSPCWLLICIKLVIIHLCLCAWLYRITASAWVQMRSFL